MKAIKKVAFLFIAAATALSLYGCSGSGKIIMGTNAAFEPFEYRNSNNEVAGFDVDIAKKIAEKLGKELVIEDVSFNSLFSLLEAKKIDFIAAGLTVTEDRKQNAEFTDTYFNAKQAVIVMKDNTTISTIEDLSGKKLGVQIATTGAGICDDIKANDAATEVTAFNAGFAAVVDLQNGKLDAVVIDNEPAKKFVAANDDIMLLDVGFDDEFYAIAVGKGNTKLVSDINKVLQDLKSSGEYDKLIEKYFE